MGRHKLVLRLRDGLEVECQASEFPPFLEIFVAEAYRIVEESGLRWADISTIVDIGANIGMATVWFSRQSPGASIVSVEPSSAAFRQLNVNVVRNDLGNRVSLVKAAVSDHSGTGHLATDAGTADGRLVDTDEGEIVEVVTLGDLLDSQGVQSIDLLKLDCEGAEYDILGSADASVLERIKCIVGEYHHADGHKPSDLSDVLGAAGFIVNLHEEVPGVGIF